MAIYIVMNADDGILNPRAKMASIESVTQPDSEYCFEVVVFEVGDKTFRVPRHGFVMPETDFPQLPLPQDEITPCRLEVDEGRFRALLRVVYPFIGCQSLSTNDWLNALDLATEWKFIEVRNRAIRALSSWVRTQPPKKVALLAKKYFILDWLKDAYLRLVQQETLTTQELLSQPALDWETIGRLLGANHTAFSNAVYQSAVDRCLICDLHSCNCQGVTVQSSIDHEFKEEFEAIAISWPQMADDPCLVDDPTETNDQ